jgi:DNA-binding response OmpR family regulator
MSENGEAGKTILIVEDSVTQALHLQALLEETGLHVVWAQDGGTGLKMTSQVRPDLIVLDVQLPDMNGFQVCQDLKAQNDTRHIPEAVMLGLQTGVTDYIPKDAFADRVLVETLRQMGLVK